MAIARYPSLVIDCPDPLALATFYGALLDWPVEASDDWAHIRAEYGDSIGLQKVDGYTPPDWPGQAMPQQMHVDVTVGTTFRVFLDPAGHPFCLCVT